MPLVHLLAPGLPNARWVAYRLIEGDHQIREALWSGELAALARHDDGQSADDPTSASAATGTIVDEARA